MKEIKSNAFPVSPSLFLMAVNFQVHHTQNAVYILSISGDEKGYKIREISPPLTDMGGALSLRILKPLSGEGLLLEFQNATEAFYYRIPDTSGPWQVIWEKILPLNR